MVYMYFEFVWDLVRLLVVSSIVHIAFGELYLKLKSAILLRTGIYSLAILNTSFLSH
jgi:hypothetical protein